tara:strand:- start:2748 stop:3065 length:318 start_codon:yes stop_codon:yes gene_type:complete
MAFKMNYNKSSFPFKGDKKTLKFKDVDTDLPSAEVSTTKVHMGPNLTTGQKELIASVNRSNKKGINSDTKKYIESKKNIKYGKHKIPRTNEEIVGFYGPDSMYQY